MLKTIKLLSVMMLLASSLAACSTAPTTQLPVKEVPGPTRVVDNSCIWFKPETPADNDIAVMSRGQVDQITNNLKVGIEHCGWNVPAAAPTQSR
jgi:hypothetical protein